MAVLLLRAGLPGGALDLEMAARLAQGADVDAGVLARALTPAARRRSGVLRG